MDFASELAAGAAALGLVLNPEQVAALDAYRRVLLSWSRAMNLLGEPNEGALLYKHLVDSLVYARAVGSAESLVDIGSGNGLPGIVLKVVAPAMHVVLLESNVKRATFLSEAARAVGLDGLEVVCARAEDAGRDPAWRERFEVVVARRVAQLNVLLEYALPLTKVGGRLVLAKGEGLEEEVAAAWGVPEMLGGRLLTTLEVEAPPAAVAAGEPRVRRFVVVAKTALTPEAYPRRAGRASKKPLRGRP